MAYTKQHFTRFLENYVHNIVTVTYYVIIFYYSIVHNLIDTIS